MLWIQIDFCQPYIGLWLVGQEAGLALHFSFPSAELFPPLAEQLFLHFHPTTDNYRKLNNTNLTCKHIPYRTTQTRLEIYHTF